MKKNEDRDIQKAISDIKEYIEKYKYKKEFIIKIGIPGVVTGKSEENKVEYTVPEEYAKELNSMLMVDISRFTQDDKKNRKRVSKLLNSRIAKKNKSKTNQTSKPRHMLDER